MPKVNLTRQYTYNGKVLGPGLTEVAPFNEDVADEAEAKSNKARNAQAVKDLEAREREYRSHLDGGGEPDAPITSAITPSGSAQPQVPPRAVGPSGAAVNAGVARVAPVAPK